MDPNACLRRFLDALAADDPIEADAAHADLRGWLEGGGFEPTWTDEERQRFQYHDLVMMECDN